MDELINDRRTKRTLPESIGLLEANTKIMQRNMETCRDEVMSRLEEHSEVIRQINKEFELVNATLGTLAHNIATESKLRREAVERAAEMHASLMTTLQQVISTQGDAQKAFQDLLVRQATSEQQSKAALDEHVKRREPLLTKMVVTSWGIVVVLLAVLWSLASDKIKEILGVAFQ